MNREARSIQIVCADPFLIRLYVAELKQSCGLQPMNIAKSAAQASRKASQKEPAAILFDESAERASPAGLLQSEVASLIAGAPLVVVAAPERQAELNFLITSGAVDFVSRTGHFVSAAASAVERHIREAERPDGILAVAGEAAGEDFGEILRHEVNNPLTGILGNAELLLARRQNLPPADFARVKTIAELAVRLRDTVRRLSNACSVHHDAD